MSAIEAVSVILAVVALAVAVFGFFASLKFHRDDVEMQGHADTVLAKIDERSLAIQTQVGGMFDRTLTAALGKVSSPDEERQQAEVLSADREPGTPPPPATGVGTSTPTEVPITPEQPGVGLASDLPNAIKILEYYGCRRMRLTDITTSPDAEAVFSLGGHANAKFNLLDGDSGALFLGFFTGREAAEVVSRVRMLLNNIELAYHRAKKGADPALRGLAKRFLDQVAVDVVVADSQSPKKIYRKIMKYQPSVRAIPLRVFSMKDVEQALAKEYRYMPPA